MVFLLVCQGLSGQNLVPNCGFSEYSDCPQSPGEFYLLDHWYPPGSGTSDFCHECSGSEVGVPYNQWGFENDLTGDGYGHIISYYPSQVNYREYMQVELACPLKPGKDYLVEFYASCSDKSQWAIDGLGLHFSEEPLHQSGDIIILLNEPAHISQPGGVYISIKDGWQRIAGTYTASGGERFITIGNFVRNADLTIFTFEGNMSPQYTSFYIDKVAVIPSEPLFDLGNDTIICAGEEVILKVIPECTADIIWEDGSKDSVRSITSPGYYEVRVTMGCSQITDGINIAWFPEPETTLPADTFFCESTTLSLTPGPGFYSYTWQDGTTAPEFIADQAGIYWAEVMDEHGCIHRDTCFVSSPDPPSVFLGEDTVLCLGKSLQLDAGDENTFSSYLWQDLSDLPEYTVYQPGNYWVEITNPCGSAMDSIQVQYENCDPLIWVPNAFTPDNDGLNDVFRPSGDNISSFRMQIYNRWGELIYETRDMSDGWNGQQEGRRCAPDVYIWVIYYEAYAEEHAVKDKIHGNVVLLR
jgi:gliding motility-associated-like protein